MKGFLWLFALAIGAVCVSRPARAWDAGGHMIAAQIAQTRLTPPARARVEELLLALRNPNATGQRYDFVTCGAWMDDIRGAEKRPGAEWVSALRPLHYVDIEDNGQVPSGPTALTAIAEAQTTLRDNTATPELQARALAILVHVCADIHQPLHAVERDQGGNLYPITGVPKLSKGLDANFKAVPFGKSGGVYQRLHALWDSAYRYDSVTVKRRKTIALLYNAGNSAQPDRTRIETVATLLQARFATGDAGDVADPLMWARESSRIGHDWVFKTARAKKPTPAYIHRAHDLACRRLVLAGYRLGDLLNATLPAE